MKECDWNRHQRCRQGQIKKAFVTYSKCDRTPLENFEQGATELDHVETDVFLDWRMHV